MRLYIGPVCFFAVRVSCRCSRFLPHNIKKTPHILVDIQPASSTECTDVVPRQCSSAEKRFH